MDSKTLAQRKSLFWRIHLWAAFIATPFALVGALTGMLYIFTPQIEAVLHGHLDRVEPPAASRPMSLDALAALAQRAAPDGAPLRYMVTPEHDHESVRAYFGPAGAHRKASAPAAPAGEHAEHGDPGTSAAATAAPGASSAPASDRSSRSSTAAPATAAAMDHRIPQGSIVYLNPYTGDVLGVQDEMDRFSTWSKRLHSSLLQGNDWRWLLELSTSWLLVMLLTGVYLWWPRGVRSARPVAATGRARWRQWHAGAGVALSLLMLVVLTTGLTWSRYAGQQIKAAADWMGQGSPETPKHLRVSVPEGQAPMGWQQVWDATRQQAPRIAYQISAPQRLDQPWRITNFDRSQPTKRFTLLLDGYSGQALYAHDWSSFTLFNKATAIGIPFHRGEFGWWNQALLLVFGLGVIGSLVSGWVMWAKRQRHGALGLPKLAPGAWRQAPAAAWGLLLVFLVALPVWAWSVLVVGLVEAVLGWRRARRAPAAA